MNRKLSEQLMIRAQLVHLRFQISRFLLNSGNNSGNEVRQHFSGGLRSPGHLILQFVGRMIFEPQQLRSFSTEGRDFKNQRAIVDPSVSTKGPIRCCFPDALSQRSIVERT